MQVINFKGQAYPSWQTTGNAARFAMPFALEVCKGEGLDIGCNRKEWAYPNATMVDPAINEYDAMNLPIGEYDYIFSSHCLEHVKESWTNVLDYWLSVIKTGGHLFLYLPHISQRYWNIDSNRKHVHQFDGSEIEQYLQSCPVKNVFVSGVDLNNSFYVVCEKRVEEDFVTQGEWEWNFDEKRWGLRK